VNSMFFRTVAASLRHRFSLYFPMIIAVTIALCLIGAARIIGNSFTGVVDHEMQKYGANVILRADAAAGTSNGIPLWISRRTMNGHSFQVASGDLSALLDMNPAWVVQGKGDLLIGQSLAEQLHIRKGEQVTFGDASGSAALLKTGMDFDSMIFISGARNGAPDLRVLRTSNPEQYQGENAIVLRELVKSKFAVLRSVERLMFYIALIAAVASIAAIVNMARIDAGSRRREFAIFQTLGALQSNLVSLIGTEYLFLATTTVLLGSVGALALAGMLLHFIAGTAPVIDPGFLISICITAVVAFGIAAGISLTETFRTSVIAKLRRG